MIAIPALVERFGDDMHDVFLGADIHATRRLDQHQNLGGRLGQPFGEPDLLLIAPGDSEPQPRFKLRRTHAEPVRTCSRAVWRASALGFRRKPDMTSRKSDRNVAIDRLSAKQHRAAAFRARSQSRPVCPPVAGVGEAHHLAIDDERAGIGLQLAKQCAREFDLAAAHEAVDAEHLAGAPRKAEAAVKRRPASGL